MFLECFKLFKPPCSLSLFQCPLPTLPPFLFLLLLPIPSFLFSYPFIPSKLSLSTHHPYFPLLSPLQECRMALKYIDLGSLSPSLWLSQSPIFSLLLSLFCLCSCQCSCPIQPLMLLCYLWHQLTGATGLKLELFHLHLFSFVLQYGYPRGHSAASQY